MKQNIRRRFLNLMTNLRFSIILLLIIASVTVIGTVIEQDKALEFYQNNYPIDNPVFGFLSWKIILLFGIDHIYSNFWFYCLMLIFSFSLLACTFSTQLPLLKVARTWKFLTKKYQFSKLSLSLVANKVLNLSQCTLALNKKGYFVFQKQNTFYAYKGLIGRISPIFVHFSLICILFGAVISASTGFIVQEVVPQGEYFHVQNLVSAGNFSVINQELLGKVEKFKISYNNDGSINQFFSTLSLRDLKGNLIKRETIYVNKPLHYDGMSIYQTDWNITGLKLSVNNRVLQLSTVPNVSKDQKNLWTVFFRTGSKPFSQYVFVIRDLRGGIDVYTNDLTYLFSQKIHVPFFLDGLEINFMEVISSTGLQIKSDPGIPIVYIGFFFLMLSSFLSYLNYSQIWIQSFENTTMLGGNSNRDVVNFEEEFYLLSKAFNRKEKSP
uniref:c-type cytochrome biogenensis protein n=1 Tax=Sahlingia subintegra TaxID=468936 RepID=UPI001FCE1B35|nr:c-type cytochrome biogenensis protein [Sahlingia subintegra]UNJ17415.1 c-type cytochrome biogenensis protein [Sahlingia subintegra]